VCSSCFEKGVAGFPNYWEYDAFELTLQRLLASGQLRPDGLMAQPLRFPYEARYTCQSCHEVWAWSVPDNAWRGYFLPAAEVGFYLEKLQRRRSIWRFGCLAFLLAVAALFFWNNFG
jgi:hypothetical protein